jgi:hypothetical protein
LYEAILVTCKTGWGVSCPRFLAGGTASCGHREEAHDVRLYKFRALITLDGAGTDRGARRYPSGTHSVMVRCGRRDEPASRKIFPAAIYRADGEALAPGDSGVVVTIEIADDQACALLGPGQQVTLWNGSDIGHGVISRRVFFTTAN